MIKRLNIDDDFILLKKMCCIEIGKPSSDAVETRSFSVKIVKELVPDNESELNVCHRAKRSKFLKCDKLFFNT